MGSNYGSRMGGMYQMNGGTSRRQMLSSNNRNNPPSNHDGRFNTSQHDDLIRYIHESWNKVSQEADRNPGSSVYYYREQEHQNLKNFQPFDLDSFCKKPTQQPS